MSQSLKLRATCVFFLALGVFLSIGPSVLYERHRLQEEALDRGLSQYNPRTGVWEWIEAESISLAGALPAEALIEPKRKPKH